MINDNSSFGAGCLPRWRKELIVHSSQRDEADEPLRCAVERCSNWLSLLAPLMAGSHPGSQRDGVELSRKIRVTLGEIHHACGGDYEGVVTDPLVLGALQRMEKTNAERN